VLSEQLLYFFFDLGHCISLISGFNCLKILLCSHDKKCVSPILSGAAMQEAFVVEADATRK